MKGHFLLALEGSIDEPCLNDEYPSNIFHLCKNKSFALEPSGTVEWKAAFTAALFIFFYFCPAGLQLWRKGLNGPELHFLTKTTQKCNLARPRGHQAYKILLLLLSSEARLRHDMVRFNTWCFHPDEWTHILSGDAAQWLHLYWFHCCRRQSKVIPSSTNKSFDVTERQCYVGDGPDLHPVRTRELTCLLDGWPAGRTHR